MIMIIDGDDSDSDGHWHVIGGDNNNTCNDDQ